MFRKGGDVGGGILLNNVVERGQYAKVTLKILKLSDSIDTIMVWW